MRILYLRGLFGQALLTNAASKFSPEELVEAEKVLTDVNESKRRVFGASHPDTLNTQTNLEVARKGLASECEKDWRDRFFEKNVSHA